MLAVLTWACITHSELYRHSPIGAPFYGWASSEVPIMIPGCTSVRNHQGTSKNKICYSQVLEGHTVESWGAGVGRGREGRKRVGGRKGERERNPWGGLLLLGYEGGVSRVLWVHSMVNLKLKSRN